MEPGEVMPALCTRCYCAHHTTEQHDQARSNLCSGITAEKIERMTAGELMQHMAPVCCPGCEWCNNVR